jgi:hypothetical protein
MGHRAALDTYRQRRTMRAKPTTTKRVSALRGEAPFQISLRIVSVSA